MSHAELEPFLDSLWTEQGLSDRTLAAYRSDLTAFGDWLAKTNSRLPAARRDQSRDQVRDQVSGLAAPGIPGHRETR